jgi:hypothetical protein
MGREANVNESERDKDDLSEEELAAIRESQEQEDTPDADDPDAS